MSGSLWPDALLASEDESRLAEEVVDEAAAIPTPLLLQLVSRFPRILLTTAVQGLRRHRTRFYLRSFARFPESFTAFTLRQPVRWARMPLENIVSEALIFDDEARLRRRRMAG